MDTYREADEYTQTTTNNSNPNAATNTQTNAKTDKQTRLSKHIDGDSETNTGDVQPLFHLRINIWMAAVRSQKQALEKMPTKHFPSRKSPLVLMHGISNGLYCFVCIV